MCFKRIDFRHLNNFGLCIGFGLGLAYQPACAGFIYYFDKRYGLACGLSSAGCSVGFIVFPPLMEVLITHFGLTGALQITSAVMANVCVCGFLLRPCKYQTDEQTKTGPVKADEKMLKVNEKKFQEHRKSKLCNFNILTNVAKDFELSLFRRVRFLFQGVLSGLLYCGIYGYFLYLYPYSVSIGISDIKSSFLMSVSGICHLIARLLPFGHLVDKKIIKASTLAGAAFLISGIDIIFLPFTKTYAGFMVLVAIYGATAGIGGSYIMVVVAYSAGSEAKASAAASWMLLHCGIGNLVGIFAFGKFELPMQSIITLK